MKKNIRVIISGGGTGGHVFPAIAIADEIKNQCKDSEILFVGADNRLEMEKVPEAGYKIIGLPIRGFQRKISFSFFTTIFRLIKSLNKAKQIIKNFRPDICIGVGGYASAAVIRVAADKKIPTLLQEQNSYPGITNKVLAPKAKAICVAYNNMERFFDKDKIFITGNPIRNLKKTDVSKNNALDFFGLQHDKKTLFITGGSLGAEKINKSIMKDINLLIDNNIQVIWQTGKAYFKDVEIFYNSLPNKNGIVIKQFIDKMDLAYKSADLVISRAGAISISELALLEKAVIFVPSPNVAEDHQTKNANALVELDAAVMIKDFDTDEQLVKKAIEILSNSEKIEKFSKNISKYAKPNATKDIVEIVFGLLT